MDKILALAQACDKNHRKQFIEILKQCERLSLDETINVNQLKSAHKYSTANTRCILIATEFAETYFVEELLNSGTSIRRQDDNQETILHKACRSGIEPRSKIKLILDRDQSLLNRGNRKGFSPLHFAVLNSDPVVPKALLEAGADVNVMSRDKYLTTPLHMASYFRSKQSVQLLLDHREIDVNNQNFIGDSASHIAASKEYIDIFKMIQNHERYNPSLTNNSKKTANQVNPHSNGLLTAFVYCSMSQVKQLLENGAGFLTDDNMETVLHKACRSTIEPYEKVKLLVEKDIKLLHAPQKNGNLSIHFAVLNPNIDVVNYLLSRCDVNAPNSNGLTPLHIAAHFGLMDVVDILINDPRCNVNAQDCNGDTPAHHANCVGKDNYASLRLLKTRSYVRNRSGKTADEENPVNRNLLRIIKMGSVHSVQCMLKKFTACIADGDGNGYLHLACTSTVDNVGKCKALLDSPGLDVNMVNKDKQSVLHTSIRANKMEVFKLVLSCPDIDINLQDYEGNTPGHIASILHNKVVLSLLHSHPRFNSQTRNSEKQRPVDIWSPYGNLSELPQTTLQMHQNINLGNSMPFHQLSRLSLIHGNLFVCVNGEALIYSLELSQVGSVATKEIGYIFQAAELNSTEFAVATKKGLYVFNSKGSRLEVSRGTYTAVEFASDRMVALNADKHNAEIYERSSSKWKCAQSFALPELYGEWHLMTCSITNTAIYVSHIKESAICKYSYTGEFLAHCGELGNTGEAGKLDWSRLCHGDCKGTMLVADTLNKRMQLLYEDGTWSVVPIPELNEYIHSAICIPGRLLVLSSDNYKGKLSSFLVTQ